MFIGFQLRNKFHKNRKSWVTNMFITIKPVLLFYKLIVTPGVKLKIGERTFLFCVPKIRNSFPKDLKETISLDIFQ